MAHLIQWSDSFNSLPVSTSKVGQTDKYIRDSRQGVAERISQEHNLNMDDLPTDNHGKHLEGSARCFISNTVVTNPDVMVETVYLVGDRLNQDFKNGRQYFNPETKKLYVYVVNYTYVDAQSVSHTVDGFVEVTPLKADTASRLVVGTCSTAAETQSKVATLDGFTLTAGAKVVIKFSNASCVSANLAINGTTAKSLYFGGVQTTAATWYAGDLVEIIYDGTNYHILFVKADNSISTPELYGNLTGDVTGNVTGDITGDLTGNADTATLADEATLGLSAGNGSPTTGKIRIPTGQPASLVKGDMWIV